MFASEWFIRSFHSWPFLVRQKSILRGPSLLNDRLQSMKVQRMATCILWMGASVQNSAQFHECTLQKSLERGHLFTSVSSNEKFPRNADKGGLICPWADVNAHLVRVTRAVSCAFQFMRSALTFTTYYARHTRVYYLHTYHVDADG